MNPFTLLGYVWQRGVFVPLTHPLYRSRAVAQSRSRTWPFLSFGRKYWLRMNTPYFTFVESVERSRPNSFVISLVNQIFG